MRVPSRCTPCSPRSTAGAKLNPTNFRSDLVHPSQLASLVGSKKGRCVWAGSCQHTRCLESVKTRSHYGSSASATVLKILQDPGLLLQGRAVVCERERERGAAGFPQVCRLERAAVPHTYALPPAHRIGPTRSNRRYQHPQGDILACQRKPNPAEAAPTPRPSPCNTRACKCNTPVFALLLSLTMVSLVCFVFRPNVLDSAGDFEMPLGAHGLPDHPLLTNPWSVSW